MSPNVAALGVPATLDPGVYFAMNVSPAVIGTTPESAAQTIAQWGFVLRPEQMPDMQLAGRPHAA